MKSFSAAALDAIGRGDAIVSGAAAIYATPAIRLWGGYGTLAIDGETYDGLGDRGIAQVSGGSIGAAAQNVTLVLSGVEEKALDVLDAAEIKGAAAVIRRLIFDSSGKNLLGAHVFTRGRVDQVRVIETVGGAATIQVLIESAARGLGRRGGRMRTDADQRLVKADDGFFKNVAFAGERTLYWGGKRPATAGVALGGGGSRDGFLDGKRRRA